MVRRQISLAATACKTGTDDEHFTEFVEDLYLAKVYTVTAERLHLDAWRSSVESKLKVVQEIFEILNRRTATYRAEALEMTIIILIALEIVLSFLR